MYPRGYKQSDFTDGDSTAYHENEGYNNLPSQKDLYNCGPFTLHYIASKVFKLDETSRHLFDPIAFRLRLLIYIIGLKFCQDIELKVKNIENFDPSKYKWLTDEDDLLHLINFFARISTTLKCLMYFYSLN